MKKTFYVTTAIDYVNAEPHIGHAYQKIVADALSRWHKLLGEDIFFLTGTDEHGKKIAESAEKANLSPKEFTDKMSEKFKNAWKKLNIGYSRFIRTTDKGHERTVLDFIKKITAKGDIYKGTYKGLYCTACETYYTEKECPDKTCPVHHKPLEVLEEESYFFKLSKYQKFLLDLYKKSSEFVLPNERKNEVINRVKEGLQDLSITRTSFNWGIPFPLDKKHIIYVWFDALINYYSSINSTKLKKYWPANYHLLGKDNGWFHAVIWPAMLKSAGIKLPKTVFIHGFLTFNGEKISKSLGNAISPVILADKYGTDTIRYFVLRQFPFAQGNDGDFSEQALIDRHNSELADKLGNLVSRVSTLAEKYSLKKEKVIDSKKLAKKVHSYLENLEFDKALNEIFTFIDFCNEYVQNKKPWETKDSRVLYQLANAIKDFTILLSPFIPETAEKISEVFNFNISIKSLNTPLRITKIKKAEILFRKILPEEKPKQTDNNKNSKKEIIGVKNMSDLIKYEDFTKLSLKVGTIKKVEDIEGADKLYKLEVDVGEEKLRTILAGIKQHYSKDELKDKQIIVICNLEPRKMRGFVSEGMLLAAASDDDSKIILLSPEKKIPSGSKIR